MTLSADIVEYYCMRGENHRDPSHQLDHGGQHLIDRILWVHDIPREVSGEDMLFIHKLNHALLLLVYVQALLNLRI